MELTSFSASVRRSGLPALVPIAVEASWCSGIRALIMRFHSQNPDVVRRLRSHRKNVLVSRRLCLDANWKPEMRSLVWPTFRMTGSVLLILSMIMFAVTRQNAVCLEFVFGRITAHGMGYELSIDSNGGYRPFRVAATAREQSGESALARMWAAEGQFSGPHQTFFASRAGLFLFRSLRTGFTMRMLVTHWLAIAGVSLANLLIVLQDRKRRSRDSSLERRPVHRSNVPRRDGAVRPADVRVD